jgi:hypothetical protein
MNLVETYSYSNHPTGTLSTAQNLFARKLGFQANLQIRSVVSTFVKRKKILVKKYFG